MQRNWCKKVWNVGAWLAAGRYSCLRAKLCAALAHWSTQHRCCTPFSGGISPPHPMPTKEMHHKRKKHGRSGKFTDFFPMPLCYTGQNASGSISSLHSHSIMEGDTWTPGHPEDHHGCILLDGTASQAPSLISSPAKSKQRVKCQLHLQICIWSLTRWHQDAAEFITGILHL